LLGIEAVTEKRMSLVILEKVVAYQRKSKGTVPLFPAKRKSSIKGGIM
jgi:hypothetical protein